MVTMKSLYLNQLRTQATHIKSGQVIITDAPIDNHGRGEAFSPTDLVCAALSSLMKTLMGITAQKEQMEMTGLTSEITKVMQSNPRKVAEICIDFYWPEPKGSPEFLESLKHAARTCPVALSLDPNIKQEISFNF